MQSVKLGSLLASDLESVFWTPARLNKASAWWGHVPFAFWITAVSKPHLFVELGTHQGVSYAAFCEAVARSRLDTRCYAVDTWTGDPQTGFYDDDVYRELKEFHDQRYTAFSELLRTTFDDACGFFADATIDLLHIDGYHTYDAVRLPKLSQRAIVLFHDTNARMEDFGVWRFFEELKKDYPTFEFSHCYGLGVALIGNDAPEEAKNLCALTQRRDILAVRQRLSHLGARWTKEHVGHDGLVARVQQLEELVARDELLAQKDSELAALTAYTHAQIAIRDAQLSVAATEKAEHMAVLAKKDAQIAGLEAKVQANDAELEKKGAQLAGAEDAVAHFPENSTPAQVQFSHAGYIARTQSQIGGGEEPIELLRHSPFFDADFYLESYPDVKAAGVDPALHYLEHGGFEGRNPGPFFSTSKYLELNPDVAEAKFNPLLHYLLRGATGRLSRSLDEERRLARASGLTLGKDQAPPRPGDETGVMGASFSPPK